MSEHFEQSRIAHHECGHALVAHRLSMRVADVRMEPDGGGICYANERGASLEDVLCYIAAGIAAERVTGHYVGGIGHEQDIADGREVLAIHGIDASEFPGRWADAERRAAEIITPDLPILYFLATALLMRERISGADVRRIITAKKWERDRAKREALADANAGADADRPAGVEPEAAAACVGRMSTAGRGRGASESTAFTLLDPSRVSRT